MQRLALLFLIVLLGSAPVARAQQAAEPSPDADQSPAQAIDKLYARLATTPYSDEAAGILGEIDRERTQSGSDTADLLFSRAMQARAGDDLPLALQLFDSVVDLYPDWSEAWSERATARFQSGDVNGAMVDIAETLKREPRDVGALAGLGAILADAGRPEDALRAYDRALALAPAYEPLKEARTRAQTAVWSRSP
jgi:tetratricopeptide (TPR) repeat protein